MTDFFDRLAFDDARELEQLSRLSYDLREARKDVLAQQAAPDESALLAGIVAGRLAEHPAYEHYLAARILADQQTAVRAHLTDRLAKIQTP